MSQWSSAKAKRVLAALLRIGWSIKRDPVKLLGSAVACIASLIFVNGI